MNELPDPLEAELSSLKPQPISPELRLGVANRLTDSLRETPRWRWRVALVGSLAAACVAAVFLRWEADHGIGPQPIVLQPETSPTVAVDDPEPTLLLYQRALSRSPEELDALLKTRAFGPRTTSPDLTQIRVLMRSAEELHNLLGEN